MRIGTFAAYLSMTVLSVESLSRSYGIKPLLTNLSFSLESDAKIGVIGKNGCRKTTLLQIVAGVETMDEGRIGMPSDTKLAPGSRTVP